MRWSHLQVGVVLVWQSLSGGHLHFLLVLRKNGLVDLDLWWGKSWGSDKVL